MSKTPEGKIKDQVKAFLASLGAQCWYYMPMSFGYGRKGIPDFIGCCNGHFFSIETKAPRGGMTPWQQREYTSITAAGGRAMSNVRDVSWIVGDFQDMGATVRIPYAL